MAIKKNSTADGPLKILIAGAGIGGLTAAIALGQQGHEVTLFEQSDFGNETGAAIHLAPNCNGILQRLGLNAEDIGANEMLGFSEYSASGKLKFSMKTRGDIWQHKWLLVHRVHLHQKLKKMALHPSNNAIPARLEKKSRVVDVDCENATITLDNGEKFQGDVVIGADGVHSKARSKIPGGNVKPFGSGKSAFRFLIPRKTLLEDPETKGFIENEGVLIMWIGEDRRLVMYPCSNNELLNYVAIHPSSETNASDGWNAGGSKDKLKEIYKEFGSEVAALLSHVDGDALKLWSLLDMEVLPTWVNGRLALLGDAAHPFLPHQGQGGGQAIEDAASLAVVLPRHTPKEEVAERLKLYEKCRYERANRIQQYTRLAGRDASEIKQDGVEVNMNEYTGYNFGHDEWHHSTGMLQKWTWARNPKLYWRMPTVFGPMPGPRQDALGHARSGARSTFVTSSIKFKTSRTFLENILPSPSFSFSTPGTIAYASMSNTTLNKMDWLGGGGYSHLGLYIHGVKYTKKDGSVINGTFLPILFESLTDPIVTGREELGMPKLYCAIDSYRRKDSLRIKAGWQGATFGNLEWEGLEKVEEKPLADTNGTFNGVPGDAASDGSPKVEGDGIFAYRYIPAVGDRGKADAEYPIFVPDAQMSETPQAHTTWIARKAKFTFEGMDWDSLPTLHHIATSLGELPIIDVVEAKIVEGYGVPDVGQAQRIE